MNINIHTVSQNIYVLQSTVHILTIYLKFFMEQGWLHILSQAGNDSECITIVWLVITKHCIFLKFTSEEDFKDRHSRQWPPVSPEGQAALLRSLTGPPASALTRGTHQTQAADV